ncbi:hypothetical protein PG985_002789 [Apiospora marii]|uniref:uncharacterized protein n=1 Tax=Apiospora marii TaxID=335849 RepID=UPI00313102F6
MASVTLLALDEYEWRGSSHGASWFSENQSTTAIIVQVTSSVFGALVVMSTTIAINLSTRRRLAKTGLKLETLRLANNLAVPRIGWTLTVPHRMATLGFFILSFVPAALWSGAFTPIATTRPLVSTIAVPSYNETWSLRHVWGDDANYTRITPQGEFTFVPHFRQGGVIIDHARNTITPDGGITTQPKLDRTGYTYTTRSFGVGSSVGLADGFQPTPKAYRYSEIGVHTTVECLYNYSSQYHLQREDKPANWSLNVYTANGSFPNHGTSAYATTALDDREACVMGTTSEPADEQGTYYAAFATLPDSTYGFLDKLQCQIFYETTLFDVAVNVTNHTIEVRPTQTLAGWEGRVPLARAATRRLNMMGQVFGATQWKSLLCDTFLTNVATLQSIQGGRTSRNDSTPYGVALTLESMVDSLLGALSAAQLVVLAESYNVTADLDAPAFRIGTSGYVLASFILNGVAGVFVFAEILRTRLWREAPDFNPMDFENVISASLAGDSHGPRLFRQSKSDGGKRCVRMRLVGEAVQKAVVSQLEQESKSMSQET